MKTLTLTFETQEELKNLIDALNNGFFVLKDAYTSLQLGCEAPKYFRPMAQNYTFAEIDELSEKRLDAYLFLYKKLVSLEKEDI